MRTGFIGLGSMGVPMAANLLAAGHEVVAYNRTASRAGALSGDGLTVAGSVADACAGGVVLSILSDDEALEAVAYGDHGSAGIIESLPDGGLHVSMSTVSVELSRRLAADHAAAGQGYVAAPVFGRPDSAEAGKLRVVAAGAADHIDKVRPLFDAVGQQTFVVGDQPEHANVVKLGGNFLIAAMTEALGEAFALVGKSGVDPAAFLEIANTVFASPIYAGYGGQIAAGRFEPALFKLALGLKDMRLVLAAADDAGVPMPLASLARDHLLEAVNAGEGELDWTAFGRVPARHAGL